MALSAKFSRYDGEFISRQSHSKLSESPWNMPFRIGILSKFVPLDVCSCILVLQLNVRCSRRMTIFRSTLYKLSTLKTYLLLIVDLGCEKFPFLNMRWVTGNRIYNQLFLTAHSTFRPSFLLRRNNVVLTVLIDTLSQTWSDFFVECRETSNWFIFCWILSGILILWYLVCCSLSEERRHFLWVGDNLVYHWCQFFVGAPQFF